MVGKINNILAQSGKVHSTVIKQISSLFSKYSSKFSKYIREALQKVVNKSMATKIASVVCNGVFKAIAMFEIFSSIGNILQYVIDCLDGKWDNYLNTKAKLKVRVIWSRS